MKFFFSILTAMTFGVLVAFVGISGVKFASERFLNPKPSKPTVTASLVDTALSTTEEDPTFISHFSRGLTYTAMSDEDLSENILGNLPASVITNQINNESSEKNTDKISAVSYIVTDLDRDTVVFEKDADHLLPIASITKLVTAVVAKKVLYKEEPVEMTARVLATEGSTGKFRIGEKIKVRELLYPLLMVSSNDAAEALAANYGRTAFIKEMNDWASDIGAYRTYFTDPSGLSPNNLSTAHDISIILKWIEKNDPDLLDITLTKEKTIRNHTWVNPTHLLSMASYEGGKNGYTTEANRTTAALFSLGEPKRLYAMVLLGSDMRDTDTVAVLNEAFK